MRPSAILNATGVPPTGRGACKLTDTPGWENLVDWFELQGVKVSHRAVKGGDATSAPIAAASIVAKVTRDQVMVELDKEHPGYGFAVHKGCRTPAHAKAIIERGELSAAHRLRVRCKAHAELGAAQAQNLPATTTPA